MSTASGRPGPVTGPRPLTPAGPPRHNRRMVTGDMLKRFSPDQLLMIAVTLGAMFSLGCAGTWYEFFWGDGDGERAMFFTAVAVFAVPLGVGAALSLRGDRRGRAPLRFGA